MESAYIVTYAWISLMSIPFSIVNIILLICAYLHKKEKATTQLERLAIVFLYSLFLCFVSYYLCVHIYLENKQISGVGWLLKNTQGFGLGFLFICQVFVISLSVSGVIVLVTHTVNLFLLGKLNE